MGNVLAFKALQKGDLATPGPVLVPELTKPAKRKRSKRAPQSWSLVQLKAILAAIPNPRNRLMVLVAFSHGLRVSEVINLTGASIVGGFVDLQRLKGSQHTTQRWVRHEDPELSEYEQLEELVKVVRLDERLFPMTRFGAHYTIREAAKRAGVPQHLRHMHCAKHTRGKLGIKTAGIEHVRQYLGHTVPGSTLLYCMVDDQEADEAMAKF